VTQIGKEKVIVFGYSLLIQFQLKVRQIEKCVVEGGCLGIVKSGTHVLLHYGKSNNMES